MESDILEYEVKWALGSITTNKASGVNGISAELFQILKDDAVKSVALNMPAKGQFSFQSQRRTPPKNVQTITQLSSSHMLAMFNIFQMRLQQYVKQELPDIQARFRKGRGTRDQIANIHWIIEKAREFQKNIHLCFIDYAKAFDCVDHNKL